MNENDISGMKGSLKSLVGSLKGSSFQKNAKSEVLKKLVGVNDTSDIVNLLGSLILALKPQLLTKDFASSKDDFLEGLKRMK